MDFGWEKAELPSPSWVCLAWSLASAGHHNSFVMERVAAVVLADIDGVHPRDVTMVLWSFATLNRRHKRRLRPALMPQVRQ